MSQESSPWPRRRLSSIVERIDYGHTATASKSVVGPKFLRITDIQDGRVDWLNVPYCKATSGDLDKYQLQAGDIVFARTGATTGKSFLITNCPNEAVFASYLIRVRSTSNVDPAFLAYFFQTSDYWNQISRQTMGAGQPGVNASRLKTLLVPLPPLSEQRRIAAILDKADAIRRKRQAALNTYDEVIYAVYHEWFEDPVRNLKKWKTKSVKQLCTLVRGSSPRPKADPRFYGGPIKRLMVEDITRDGRVVTPRIDSLTIEGAKRSRPCPAGTVVMVVSGNVGLPAKLAVDACIHDGFVGFLGLDADLIRPDFLVLTLEMLKVTHERFRAGAIWQNLTTTQVKAMEIPLPSLEQQDRFSDFGAKHKRLAETLCATMRAEVDLFNSLVRRAFNADL